jgi:hypothetical protein
MRKTFGFALALFAFGCLLGHLCGCSSPQAEPAIVEKRAANAVDLVQYNVDLAECRAVGRDAGYGAYEACAKRADKRAGVTP